MELLGAHVDPVPQRPVAVDEKKGDHVHPVRSHHRVGQVRARVDKDAHRSANRSLHRATRGLELGEHVLRLVRRNRPQGRAVVDRIPGVVGVQMDLENLAAADHQQLFRALGERRAHGLLGGQIRPLHQDLRAVAPGPLPQRVVHGSDGRPVGTVGIEIPSGCRGRPRRGTVVPVPDQPDHPLDHLHESLRARVHDARLRENGEEVRCPLERVPGRIEESSHQVREIHGLVAVALTHPARRRRRGVAYYREDRALYRLLHRGIQRARSRHEGRAELVRGSPRASFQPAGEANEELGQHHPAVPPGTHHGGPGHPRGHPVHPPFARGSEIPCDRIESKRQVGARVSIRHREDVDAVELRLVLARVRAGREEGPPQARSVHIGDSTPVGHGVTLQTQVPSR